jgi:hypothetical protein
MITYLKTNFFLDALQILYEIRFTRQQQATIKGETEKN